MNLSDALGDLAETMTDDPARLTGVHRRTRALRARRTARRGVVAGGALGVAAATGVLLRPSGGSPDTQVAATQPSTAPTTTPPAGVATTEVPSCPDVPPTTWPEGADYILESFTAAQVMAVDGEAITFQILDRPADSALPEVMTLTLGPEVTFTGDQADLVPGRRVEIYVQQAEDQTDWGLAHLVIDPASEQPDC